MFQVVVCVARPPPKVPPPFLCAAARGFLFVGSWSCGRLFICLLVSGLASLDGWFVGAWFVGRVRLVGCMPVCVCVCVCRLLHATCCLDTGLHAVWCCCMVFLSVYMYVQPWQGSFGGVGGCTHLIVAFSQRSSKAF